MTHLSSTGQGFVHYLQGHLMSDEYPEWLKPELAEVIEDIRNPENHDYDSLMGQLDQISQRDTLADIEDNKMTVHLVILQAFMHIYLINLTEHNMRKKAQNEDR